MPFKLSTLMSPRANRSSSRSPTSSRNQRKLYFPPGGHTHDRHTIPPDRLHISLSDPVLVAAEERLSSTPDRSKLAIAKESSARRGTNPRSTVSQFSKGGGFLSRKSGDNNDGPLVGENMDLIMATSTRAASQRHSWQARFRRAAVHVPSPPDSSDESCDIVEVMSMSSIDISPGNTDRSENSRNGPDLAPLASETFKEELYIRGYLKRPASRPANVIPRKSRATFTLMSRFPKVLGRRQGRKVAETLRAEQAATNALHGCDAHLSAVASVTLRAPHADGLESPGLDTTTSASESFDLHEFSYITAFTTPPSSPSIVLDAETFRKGVCLGDSEHAA